MTSIRRVVGSGLLAGTLLVSTAGVALAHECVISSRSDQGDTGALHSGARSGSGWPTCSASSITLWAEHLSAHPRSSGRSITAIAAGLPADGWVICADKTIGAGSNNANLADGKGLDHLVPLVGEQIVGIYFEVLSRTDRIG